MVVTLSHMHCPKVYSLQFHTERMRIYFETLQSLINLRKFMGQSKILITKEKKIELWMSPQLIKNESQ